MPPLRLHALASPENRQHGEHERRSAEPIIELQQHIQTHGYTPGLTREHGGSRFLSPSSSHPNKFDLASKEASTTPASDPMRSTSLVHEFAKYSPMSKNVGSPPGAQLTPRERLDRAMGEGNFGLRSAAGDGTLHGKRASTSKTYNARTLDLETEKGQDASAIRVSPRTDFEILKGGKLEGTGWVAGEYVSLNQFTSRRFEGSPCWINVQCYIFL